MSSTLNASTFGPTSSHRVCSLRFSTVPCRTAPLVSRTMSPAATEPGGPVTRAAATAAMPEKRRVILPRAEKRYSPVQQVYDGDDEASDDGVLDTFAEAGEPCRG